MKFSKEIKAGVTITVAIVVFIWGFNYLKGYNAFSSQRVFYAKYSQIDGLKEASPVYLNGYKVGSVRDIQLISNDEFMVKFAIDAKEVNLPSNSVARIINTDFLSTKALNLDVGTVQSGNRLFSREGYVYAVQARSQQTKIEFPLIKAPADQKVQTNAILYLQGNRMYYVQDLDTIGLGVMGERIMLQDGDTLFSEVEASFTDQLENQLRPLQNKTIELVSSMDSVLVLVQRAFSSENIGTLESSFRDVRKTIATLKHTTLEFDTLITDNRGRLTSIFANMESISSNIKGSNRELRMVIENFAHISDTLKKAQVGQTIMNANNALKETYEVMDKINNGDGSLSELLNNPELFNSLQKSATDLNYLIQDIEKHPEDYLHFSIFGKKGKHKLKLSAKEEEQLKQMLNKNNN